MGQTGEMLVGLACVMGSASLLGVCNCPKSGPVPAPSTAPSSTAPVTASSTPPPPPKPAWKAATSLEPLEGSWGSKVAEEGWAELSSKKATIEKGGKWVYPYPWHLLVHEPEQPNTYDCGVHEELMDDGQTEPWRVAYCEGGDLPPGRRHAERLILMLADTEQELLHIDVVGLATVELDRN